MAPAALPIWEVVSASMEPSAEMMEPRYVNEGTNLTCSPSMFIGVVITEEGEILVALALVQLIEIPTLAAKLKRSGETTHLGGRRIQWRTIQTSHFRHEHSFFCRSKGVLEFFWGSARDADEIQEGYAVNAVVGGFTIYECDV